LQPVVGASGAISGIMIALIAWVVLNREALPGVLINRILGAMFGNLAMLVYFSFLPGVSWQGHLGGAVGGLLVSGPLNWHRFGRGWRRWLAAVGIALVPAAAVGLVLVVHADLRRQVREQVAVAPLRSAFAQAEPNAFVAYEKHYKPLAGKKSFIKTSKDAKEQFPGAASAFERAQTDLKLIVEQFRKAGPLPTDEQIAAVKQALAYLEAWGEFFSWAKIYCDDPAIENSIALANQHHQLEALVPGQQQSVFFPSGLKLEADPQKKKSKAK